MRELNLCLNPSETAAEFLKSAAYGPATTTMKNAGRVVDHHENLAVIDRSILDPRGFSIEDILWTIGIWSVILTMSPVILFYLLMVA
jgi:hypothetical protein